MRATVEIEVKECSNCPFRHYSQGHGENLYSCSHPYAPSGYGNIIHDGIERNESWFPIWCPLLNSILDNKSKGSKS